MKPRHDDTMTAAEARRLFLLGQGLLDDPAGEAGPDRVYAAVERLGFVQMDSISAVERAHHLILAARLDGYRLAHLTHLLEADRRLFEHWTHDAAAVPSKWFPSWRLTFARRRRAIRDDAWWQERLGPSQRRIVAAVRARLERHGPLATRDFAPPAGRDGRRAAARTNGSWWGWGPEKAALEMLWHTGVLLVTRREGFEKVYDLAERVLPEACAAPPPARAEHVDWACRTALDRLGAATPAQIAAFWSHVDAERAAAWCARAARAGRLVRARVERADADGHWTAWAPADWRARLAAAPPAPARQRLLAPFDPLLWDRKRVQRLFGFDYAFEAFVPAAKRRWGYYVMPILDGERLVGRVDPKLERDTRTLALRAVWWEPGVRPTRARRRDLEAAAQRLATALGATRIAMPRS
jgi:uncharacterized protein YcaQ